MVERKLEQAVDLLDAARIAFGADPQDALRAAALSKAFEVTS